MKTMMLAAAAVLSLSAGSAFASEGGPIANTEFTQMPGVLAQAPAQNAPAATAQSGQAVRVYATQTSRDTSVFAPNENGNG